MQYNLSPPVLEVLIFSMPEYVYYLVGFTIGGWLLVEFLIWRVGKLGQRKKEMLQMQYEYARLEDKALRAQMNPHFIFNSMNSIKLLVQENNNEKAISYLTTFTKLLRGLLMNADKSKTTLFDELEICRLYLSLEALRFSHGFSYSIKVVPEDLDLKAIEVPALILQPFVENAIWHGLMPKDNNRQLLIEITQVNDWIRCLVDDNGIGRAASGQKERSTAHESKGMQLSSNRLKLNNQIHNTEAKITIRDKQSENGESQGTQVELMLAIND